MSAVEVSDLRVELTGSRADVVDDVSLSIDAGEVVGLVGESGSGKTTIAVALLGTARRGARIARGEVRINGTNILALSPERLRRLRGNLVAYVPQDPSAALNPALRIGRQLGEMLEVHDPASSKEARRERIQSVMREVHLPGDRAFLRRYPHQLSGGQQQRVAIAMAFILHPKVIVLDEPTTGLDVTTQAHVLATVRELCTTHGVAALYVSHDLAVVGNLAHRVVVAYAGRVVEAGTCDDLFDRPAHPYTRRLLATIPVVSERRAIEPIAGSAPVPGERPPDCFFAPRCPHALDVCTAKPPPVVEVAEGHTARCVRARELVADALQPTLLARTATTNGEVAILAVNELDTFYGDRQILHDISLRLKPRECLALVGESGSGKTTLARAIIGLVAGSRGRIDYKGTPLEPSARARSSQVRREIQYIFQSPYNSLNPRRTIGDSVAAPLEHFFDIKGSEARNRVDWALERVSLPRRFAGSYPDELSGGERQRVAIARALICEPEVLICDEVTSALDVSVQASIVRLLEQLQHEHDLAMLFVTHNLALVRTIADRVIVMEQGRIVEDGTTNVVLDEPQMPYTQALLADTPTLAGRSGRVR
jgi:peptide/nickel transport system ATP-binding protein